MKSSNKLDRQAKSLKHALGGSTYFLSTLLVFLFCLCELLPMPAFKINQPEKLKNTAVLDKANVWRLIKVFLTPFFFPELGLEFPWGWCTVHSEFWVQKESNFQHLKNCWTSSAFFFFLSRICTTSSLEVQFYFDYFKIWMEARLKEKIGITWGKHNP